VNDPAECPIPDAESPSRDASMGGAHAWAMGSLGAFAETFTPSSKTDFKAEKWDTPLFMSHCPFLSVIPSEVQPSVGTPVLRRSSKSSFYVHAAASSPFLATKDRRNPSLFLSEISPEPQPTLSVQKGAFPLSHVVADH